MDNFSGISGSEGLIHQLKQDLQGRLFHNYLFLGRHHRRERIIRAFAGEILGVAWDKLEVHPDFRVLSPTKTTSKRSIKKDAVEAMIQEGERRPTVGSHRVFLLEEFSLTTVEGQNAFLKTLEEPRPGVVFLLTSDSEEGILPTILSRASVIPFPEMSQGELLAELSRRGFSPEKSRELITMTSGDGHRLLSFLDHENGIGLRGELFRLLGELSRGGYGYGRLAKFFLDHPDDGDLLFYFLESWARDVATAALERGLPLINEDFRGQLENEGRLLGPRALGLLSLILEHKAAFRYNGNEQLIFENLFLQLGAQYG
ncbi:MAG: hypothetical protein Q4E76_01120 [Tissierellia bacterium]|nr:hypothetical protein [Tissierellia bacterium]